MFTTQTFQGTHGKTIRFWQKDQLRLEILADHGASINRLRMPNREENLVTVLAGYPEASPPVPKEDPYRGVFLFPFPNRLKDGCFTFQDKEYQFPINEENRNHALHGLLFQSPFEVFETSESVEMASVRLRFESHSGWDYFPFSFRIEVEYVLTERDGLRVQTQVVNTGSGDLPYGLGWHPYVETGSDIHSWIIQFPETYLMELDQRMIPSGQTLKYRNFESPQPLGNTVFDTGFRIPDSIEVFKVRILDHENQLKFTFWQQSDPDGYRFFQMYTSPDRKSLALEPMTCPANGLQSGQFHILEPGATQIFTWGIN